MTRFLLVGAALAPLAVIPAMAGDLDTSPYPKSAAIESVYNWTGVYFGANGGGGMAASERLDPDGLSRENTKFQRAFGTAGAGAGLNYQFGHGVLGVEADYNWAGIDSTKTLNISGLPADAEYWFDRERFKIDEFATVRIRGGLAVDRTLVYATAGVVFAHLHNSSSFFESGATKPYAEASQDKWKPGLAVGAGVEFALSQNWTLKGEYLYMMFQDSEVDILYANPLFNPSCSFTDTGFNCRMNYTESVQLARVGLNYRFGW